MFDIDKVLTAPERLAHDAESDMYDLEPWSCDIARTMGRYEGLGDLSKMHWRVIHRLRGHYRNDQTKNMNPDPLLMDLAQGAMMQAQFEAWARPVPMDSRPPGADR